MSSEDLEAMLGDCDEARTCSNSPFSKWEDDFVISVKEQFEERGGLSQKQQDVLHRIWDKI